MRRIRYLESYWKNKSVSRCMKKVVLFESVAYNVYSWCEVTLKSQSLHLRFRRCAGLQSNRLGRLLIK